jgi:deoxyribodipyrimidine photolyase
MADVGIMWFRRDLRVRDVPALAAAAQGEAAGFVIGRDYPCADRRAGTRRGIERYRAVAG